MKFSFSFFVLISASILLMPGHLVCSQADTENQATLSSVQQEARAAKTYATKLAKVLIKHEGSKGAVANAFMAYLCSAIRITPKYHTLNITKNIAGSCFFLLGAANVLKNLFSESIETNWEDELEIKSFDWSQKFSTVAALIISGLAVHNIFSDSWLMRVRFAE